MMRGLLIAKTTTVAGGAEMMEHPAEPDRPECASFWTTGHQQMMMHGPFADLVTIQQHHYGAHSQKSTMLRSVGLPSFAQSMKALQDVHSAPATKTLIGFDQDKNQFNTAEAKEYPDKMSRAISIACLDGLQSRILHSGVSPTDFDQLSESTQTWILQMSLYSQTSKNQQWLPDYQPCERG